MNKRYALIVTTGFIGDILFASSVAEHLIQERQFDGVDYLVGFPQPIPLMKLNPFIRNVYLADDLGPHVQMPRDKTWWDAIFQQPILSFEIPPAEETQIACGVKNPSADFTVYTDKELDKLARIYVESKRNGRKVIAWVSSWQDKSYIFTPEQYAAGIDVPGKGYGGQHRDIPYILAELNQRYTMIEVGFGIQKSQFDLAVSAPMSFEYQASLIKHCDYLIGPEGGLANVAYGVGTKTILTSDFVLQLYGWNGVCKKVKEPKLGPRFYGKPGHIDLDPYLSDGEIVNKIMEIVG